MPPLIDKRVVVGTVLMIVLTLDVAFVNLEDLKIEMFDHTRLSALLMDSFEFVK